MDIVKKGRALAKEIEDAKMYFGSAAIDQNNLSVCIPVKNEDATVKISRLSQQYLEERGFIYDVNIVLEDNVQTAVWCTVSIVLVDHFLDKVGGD